MAAATAAGLVWIAAWTPAYRWKPGFGFVALAVLGRSSPWPWPT